MSVRTRLILSVVSAGLVVVMIVFGMASVLGSKRYVWNSNVDIINDVSDLSLEINGFINGMQDFEATAENGTIDKTSWQIDSTQTTFTKQRSTIVIQLIFFNKSNTPLKITIDGILIDPWARFSTTATDGNGVGIDIVTNNNVGSLEAVLEGGNNKTKVINLNYTLEKTNLNIEGEQQDTQRLQVSISLAG